MSAGSLSKADLRTVAVPVRIGGRDAVVGTHVARPAPGDDRGVLQVLVHGGTYDHRYWNAAPVNGRAYSYSQHALAHGYSVLAVDQLGVGASSRPPGDQVTLDVASDALSQVIAAARIASGPLGHAVGTVVLVGHSIGTIVSVHAQATHHPADLLVTTGLGHTPAGPPPFPDGVVEQAMELDYVSLPAHARSGAFYAAELADPAVIAYDNAELASPIARGLLADAFAAARDNEFARVGSVTGPVFVQLGEFDRIGPADAVDEEPAHWASTGDVVVEVVPGIGHDFNLHLAREASWSGITRYLDARTVG